MERTTASEEGEPRVRVDPLLEMVHIVASAYGFTDEYILEKPMRWLLTRVAFCQRERHDRDWEMANMILHQYASAMSKEVEAMTRWDWLRRDEEGKVPDDYLPAVEELRGKGFGIKQTQIHVESKPKEE